MATVARHIIVKASPDKAAEIERIWKQECGPLMQKQAGCIREELLRCREEPGEFISVAEWDSPESIQRYLDSPAHEEIKRHTRGLTGMAATVKTYELVAEKEGAAR
jgi:heme-degrading monooxygenase HmoA